MLSTWLARKGHGPDGGPGGPEYDAGLSDAAQGGTTPRRERSWEIHERRQAEHNDLVVSLLQQIARSMGGVFSTLTNPPANDVLFAGSIVVDPAGGTDAYEQLDFKQDAAYVAIFNYSASVLWLIEGGYGGGNPGTGAGRFQIQPGESRGVPMKGSTITVLAVTAPESGPTCDLVVYARPKGAFSSAL